MFEFRCAIAIVLGICFVNVSGEDAQVSWGNYSQVFNEMPVLFERIMEMLHERPEVLEKNDMITFHDNKATDQTSQLSSDENGVKLDKREVKFKYNSIDDLGATGAELEYDWQLLRANDDFGGFIGSVAPGGSQLTADEVSERMLMVERKLDEYNDTN